MKNIVTLKCQRIKGTGIIQLTLQPQWPYCEIPEDMEVTVIGTKRRETIVLCVVAFRGATRSWLRVGDGVNPVVCPRQPQPGQSSYFLGITWALGWALPWYIPSSKLDYSW